MFISQPALSQQIKALEASLGVDLFVRGAQGVSLTAEGQGILPEARLLLAAADQLVEQARFTSPGQDGLISLGYLEHALGSIVPTFLESLLEAAPDVSVTLTSFPPGDRALDGLIDGRCDLVIMRGTHRTVTGLRTEPLASEEMVAAVPVGHPLAARERVSLAELAAEPFAFVDRESDPEGWDAAMALFDAADGRPSVVQTGHRMQEALLWVGSGQGVTLVPASVARVIAGLDVEFRPLTGEPRPTLDVVLAWIEPNANPRLATMAAAAETARRRLAGTPGMVHE